MAQQADTRVIVADPGDMITFNGTGLPGSDVAIGISTSVAVDSRQGRYSIGLDGLEIPAGKNRFSLDAGPVETMTVSGGTSLIKGLSMVQGIKVANQRGSFSISDVPPGQYDIMVYGDSNASQVRLNVSARCIIDCDGYGGYSASVNTKGMPPGIYEVRQNGSLAALVYLGVPGPAAVGTPTGNSSSTPHIAVISGNNRSSDSKTLLSGEPGILTTMLVVCAFMGMGIYLLNRRKKDP